MLSTQHSFDHLDEIAASLSFDGHNNTSNEDAQLFLEFDRVAHYLFNNNQQSASSSAVSHKSPVDVTPYKQLDDAFTCDIALFPAFGGKDLDYDSSSLSSEEHHFNDFVGMEDFSAPSPFVLPPPTVPSPLLTSSVVVDAVDLAHNRSRTPTTKKRSIAQTSATYHQSAPAPKRASLSTSTTARPRTSSAKPSKAAAAAASAPSPTVGASLISQSSAFRGVSCCGRDRKWQARIRDRKLNRVKYLGRFVNQIEAALEYDKFARTCKGPNALTNFIRLTVSQQEHLVQSFNAHGFLPEDCFHLLGEGMETRMRMVNQKIKAAQKAATQQTSSVTSSPLRSPNAAGTITNKWAAAGSLSPVNRPANATTSMSRNMFKVEPNANNKK